jgi:hypothetical protein
LEGVHRTVLLVVRAHSIISGAQVNVAVDSVGRD